MERIPWGFEIVATRELACIMLSDRPDTQELDSRELRCEMWKFLGACPLQHSKSLELVWLVEVLDETRSAGKFSNATP